jgi:hypothetical protein
MASPVGLAKAGLAPETPISYALLFPVAFNVLEPLVGALARFLKALQ